jgi:drug/metabolite transporter (DMT)-like permease
MFEQNQTRFAYILLTFACLFWGGNFVAGKMAVGEIAPMLLTLSRWVIAATTIVFFAIADLKHDWVAIRKHWLLLAFYGAFGFTLFNALLYVALSKTSAVNASIVQAALPVTVYLLNFMLFRVKINAWQITGFFVTLTGVMVVASHGDFTRLSALDVNTGDVLALIAVITYALYTLFLRYKPHISWKSLIVILASAAALAAAPLAMYEWQSGNMFVPTGTGLVIMLYAGIFPSIISQLFFIKGVELIGPNRAGIFINLIPVFGTGLAIAILGETLEGFHIVALALVIAGIWLAERRM